MYDGTNFANKDVVYVSINYRLGILGFWDFRKLGEEFDSNVGISDQITALNWIKHNISSFGGDPDNVTICGESAGGISVLYLLSSPSTKGLFNKAISESALPYSTFDDEAEKIYTDAFLKNSGISLQNRDKLFEYSVKELADLMFKTNEEVSKEYPGYTIPAAVKDDLVPYDVLEGCKKRINNDVKLLIGTNRDEGTLFCNPSSHSLAPYDWKDIGRMLSLTGNSDIFESLKDYFISTYKEKSSQEFAYNNLFLRGSLDILNERIKYQKDSYLFRFDYATPITKKIKINACHSLEMSFALGTTNNMVGRHPFFKEYDEKEIKNIEEQMHTAWVNFTKTGNPNSKELKIDWPKYQKEDCFCHIFNIEPSTISFKDYKPLELFKGRRIYTK
jgi:para-nitrobenzyl esterase